LATPPKKPLYIETIPRKGYSFMGEPEFAMQPFPQTDSGASSDAANAGLGETEKEKSVKNSDRWLTFGIIALILAGILLGAGIATFWISRFAPEFRHSANKPHHNTTSSISE